LFLSAFFSASETALMSLSKIRVRHMVEEKIKGAELINKLVENPSRLLGAILVGNNIVNIGAAALATSIAIKYFGNKGVGIATGLMTLAVLIFGEITPKSLAANNPQQISLRIAKPINLITILLNPVIVFLTHITRIIIKIFGGNIDTKQPFITEEELKTIVDVSHEEGVLEVEEKQMIHNVVEFGDLLVKEIMIPRTEMAMININAAYDEIISAFQKFRFSRMPIYKDNTDNIVGILYLKDLFLYNDARECFNIQKYLRECYYTIEFKRIKELFENMRKNKLTIAIVLDEYGGTVGIVTMEDLIEKIVGEIGDEYDGDNREIEAIKENEYLVDGGTKIDLVNEILGLNIESENYDSIGGFVIGELGRFPVQGEKVMCQNVKIITETVEGNKIIKLEILL
jgi:putative hemolysin